MHLKLKKNAWVPMSYSQIGLPSTGGCTRDASYTYAMASPEAKNLEAISKAIDQHNSSCPFPAAEVRMNPFEVERLGWEQIRGLPVIPDGEIGTGRFRIVCSRDVDDSGLEITEAVGKELETVAPSSN